MRERQKERKEEKPLARIALHRVPRFDCSRRTGKKSRCLGNGSIIKSEREERFSFLSDKDP
jgi:hypothetical protein